ncbi:exosome complex RNA-binding protein Rrp4 [uncultured Methanobrevibacter sp.]|uniref:exosome complex RNA-binding protein Rrp4 n=1 Tax=uncultured Methanobrevibacter sp. TaxID=253161 RepID=UPI00374217C9
MIYVEDKNLVIPGQILADDEYYPGRGTFKEGDKICSSLMGLVSLRNKKIRVIPLKSKYVPKKGDVVIGKINDVRFSMWDVDINSPYSGILPAFEVFGRDKKELSKVYDVGDVLFLRVIDVDEVKKAKLGLKGRGLGKFKGGIIVDISPTKVPRLIGKKGSMINMIKNKTNCKIVVGQNGLVWVKGDEDMEQLTREIIHTIEAEAHTSGLTNKIKNKLCLAIDGELPEEEVEEEFVLEKPKLQNFKEELEQEEREKAEAENEIGAESEVEDETPEEAPEDVDEEALEETDEESSPEDNEEAPEESDDEAEDKPNFYDVIKELKKKSQKDKNLSYSDNSNNNSFILNNR